MNNKPKIWLNNKITAWEDATVPVLSHALSRGSALFEAFGTHRVPGGVATFRMDAHMRRMENTLRLLEMELKFSTKEISEAVATLAEVNKVERGLVKVMAYWGEEAIINLVLRSKLDVAIFMIPEMEGLGVDDATPLTACISKWNKPDPGAIPVQAKACANYLGGYLVRKDANDRGFDLGLTMTKEGLVAEGSIESVFIVKDGILKTPPLDNILASVSRDSILQACRQNGIDVQETTLTRQDLDTADEMFSCHSANKVTPINRFEDRDLEAPGPVTSKVAGVIRKIMDYEDDRFKDWFQILYKN